MPLFLVSPAEPPLIRAIGKVSDLVERHGADILWAEPAVHGLVGVQRKYYTDLLESVQDGRLQREIPQLSKCKERFLVVEGRPQWTPDSHLNHKWLGGWTRDSYRSLLRSLQFQGLTVEFSDDEADTVVLVESIAKWVAKGEHSSLQRRPKNNKDRWGQKDSRSMQVHLLQGFDDLGPKVAGAIVDHFGCLPWQWTVTEDELLAVKGVGKKTVATLTRIVPARG